MLSYVILLLCVILPVLFVHIVSSQNIPQSPCPEVFQYNINEGQSTGTIRVSPPYSSRLRISINMVVAGVTSSPNRGKVDITDGGHSALQKIIAGDDIFYSVTFPVAPSLPYIRSIIFNGRQICSGPPIQSYALYTVTLYHTYTTNIPNPFTGSKNIISGNQNSNNFNNDKNIINNDFNKFNTNNNGPNPIIAEYPNVVPEIPSTTTQAPIQTTPRRVITTTTTPRPSRSDITCGMPKKVNNALILRGDSTSKGEWPWLSALFLNERGSLSFICGGSLIKTDLVITAGHCLIQRNYNRISKEKFVVMLGLFNVQDWADEDNFRTTLSEIVFHPSFESGVNLKNDIAILKLQNLPPTNDFIIPVCIWTDNYNILPIPGQYGTIVGWGRDENGLAVSPEPRVTRQRVVTTDQCRDSNQDFSQLLSSSTICAGNRNGTGPCNGDSGGGMFFRVDGRWLLRGIVSTSLSRPEAPNACNTKDYVIFTDVNKFVPWINTFMN